MPHGTIKSINRDKGFGFIRPETKGNGDFFFHKSGVLNGDFEELTEGQRVSFEEESSPKGPRATEVEPV